MNFLKVKNEMAAPSSAICGGQAMRKNPCGGAGFRARRCTLARL
jgi:hypothetical protein